MALQVTGKNLDVGEALRSYVTERIQQTLDKYSGTELGGHVRIEKERGNFRADCSILLRSGLSLQSHGESQDAYAAADQALERLEKRLRRYRRRLKSHHASVANSARSLIDETDGTVDAVEIEDEVDEQETDAANPVIVAERGPVMRLTVGDAVKELDLTEQPFLVFRNAGNDRLNVVYRRSDGNIGWIDPVGPDGRT